MSLADYTVERQKKRIGIRAWKVNRGDLLADPQGFKILKPQ